MADDDGRRLPGGDGAARLSELRRRVYSRGAEADPVAARADRELLDRLEAEALAPSGRGPIDSPPAPPAPTNANDAGALAEPSPRIRLPDRRARVAALVITIVAVLGAGTAAWLIATTPPTADAIAVFDRAATSADASPFSPDFTLVGGAEIDELRLLGGVDERDVWAATLADGQICLITRLDATSAGTCATAEEFARTGLTLEVMSSAEEDHTRRGDVTITWGPDSELTFTEAVDENG